MMTIVSPTDQRPLPILTDIQRERAEMLATFEAPYNFPLPVFAKLAGKSRHQPDSDLVGRTRWGADCPVSVGRKAL